MPPVNIRVRDHRAFGRKPTVGMHVIRSLEKYIVDSAPKATYTPGEDRRALEGKGFSCTQSSSCGFHRVAFSIRSGLDFHPGILEM